MLKHFNVKFGRVRAHNKLLFFLRADVSNIVSPPSNSSQIRSNIEEYKIRRGPCFVWQLARPLISNRRGKYSTPVHIVGELVSFAVPMSMIWREKTNKVIYNAYGKQCVTATQRHYSSSKYFCLISAVPKKTKTFWLVVPGRMRSYYGTF